MITHSEKESKLFNLKFGRYEGIMHNPQLLRHQILNEQFDFVRLKLLNPGEDLFVFLNQIGFPFHLLDIHRLYDLDLHTYDIPEMEVPEMEFVPCDGSQIEQMKQLIKDTYTEVPMGYFRSELIEKYFPVHLQIENFASHISENYFEQGNPAKHGWLIKLNEEFIGCAATEFKNEKSYTPYIGLLPHFRKKHLFTNIARYLQRAMKQGGCQYATGAARLHNIASQVNFEREGQKYVSHDYVFMLMPGLTPSRGIQ